MPRLTTGADWGCPMSPALRSSARRERQLLDPYGKPHGHGPRLYEYRGDTGPVLGVAGIAKSGYWLGAKLTKLTWRGITWCSEPRHSRKSRWR